MSVVEGRGGWVAERTPRLLAVSNLLDGPWFASALDGSVSMSSDDGQSWRRLPLLRPPIGGVVAFEGGAYLLDGSNGRATLLRLTNAGDVAEQVPLDGHEPLSSDYRNYALDGDRERFAVGAKQGVFLHDRDGFHRLLGECDLSLE